MSQTYTFHTLDVFTEQIFGGNPLAVFPQAQGLSSHQMQAIAKELNLSETVFVFPTKDPDTDFQLRIFTPAAEIPFAGHPTVGTAYLLAHLGYLPANCQLVRFQEEVGIVPVSIYWEQDQVRTTALSAAQLPQFIERSQSIDYASLVNLPTHDLHPVLKPAVISCGLPFLYLPLKDLDALSRCSLNRTLWEKAYPDQLTAHIYPFVVTEDNQIYARMFAPGLGIAEDPATGSAATSLAGYLHRYLPSQATLQTWQIYQGIQMGRPSQLMLTMQQQKGELTEIAVGGSSVLVSVGHINVPTF
ncbi:PhzF family phenazine biosynthesis protein [Picosynechococcus sp. PCC 11901]|uniref:PhzF family phenazine biosynthesis protein n=1 Tax=Picosynechococcus sp. PCC 11901 TaxID=2579791 RepID=UPI0010FC1E15|nr:PhzF family phenazine biosynthesis protein [Picosynechococcus sp. PCC 11901]QCS48702.1 PhzF family phenazine biosynthesis protein [Picosynechococcus sp. PCC 11901]